MAKMDNKQLKIHEEIGKVVDYLIYDFDILGGYTIKSNSLLKIDEIVSFPDGAFDNFEVKTTLEAHKKNNPESLTSIVLTVDLNADLTLSGATLLITNYDSIMLQPVDHEEFNRFYKSKLEAQALSESLNTSFNQNSKKIKPKV